MGAYLPLSTTSPIFVGGLLRAFATRAARRRGESAAQADSELGPGNLFATGLVAGGAVAGVAVALLTVNEGWAQAIGKLSVEHVLTGKLGPGGYQLLGVICFAAMGAALWRAARAPAAKP